MLFKSRKFHLDPSEHACSGHAEVQISYHLCCGGLIDVGGPTTRKVICKQEHCSLTGNIAEIKAHQVTTTKKQKKESRN